MEHYFMVLELPGGDELKFKEGRSSTDNFWQKAAEYIVLGKAQIISRRQDTGVSEELRRHVSNITKFTTFVLVHMKLNTNDLISESVIFKKIARWIMRPDHELVIDSAENFQLVTIDI